MSESPRRIVAAALGLTTICLAWIEEPLVDSRHKFIYHWSGRPLNLFAPVVLDVLICWLLFTLLLLWARAPGRRRAAIWGGTFFAPSIALKNLVLLSIVGSPHLLSFTLFGVEAVAYVMVLLLWRPSFAKRFDHVVGLISTVLGFVAIPGAVLLGHIFWSGWQARSLNDPLPLHSPQIASTTSARPRVIWIVLDELSYQQVYEHRFQGLQLPAFDALATQSTVFTQTIPASVPVDNEVLTEKILPSLLTGEPVDEIRSSATGQLSTHNPETKAWQQFDQHNTAFQDALDAGYNTAVAGWYNPYCRIMPAVLERCSWIYGPGVSDGLAPGFTVGSNMLRPMQTLAETGTFEDFLRHLWVPNLDAQNAEVHIEDYRQLADATDTLLRDPSLGFILLHVPIPHPNGIYSRATGQLTTGASTYIDNLALADKYLASVRSTLEQTGQWDSSTVVVMGDHGWRTSMTWKQFPIWTQEEENASQGGRFDRRPAYIVKLAGQQKSAVIDAPFRAAETRKLMDALLAQKIQSQEDLSAWVQQTH